MNPQEYYIPPIYGFFAQPVQDQISGQVTYYGNGTPILLPNNVPPTVNIMVVQSSKKVKHEKSTIEQVGKDVDKLVDNISKETNKFLKKFF